MERLTQRENNRLIMVKQDNGASCIIKNVDVEN